MPAGDIGSYSFFLAFGPLLEKFAPANLLSEAVIVFELTPGNVRCIVSTVWFMIPTFMTSTCMEEGAE